MPSETDTITKQVTINAPIDRTWEAVGHAAAFGAWFGIDFAGQEFEPGKTLTAMITDPPEYAGVAFPITVVAVEPPRRLAFRWHPNDPAPENPDEPTTLIEFVLETAGEGTLLTVIESGFDSIPEEKRADAFRQNTEGWEQQVERVRAYVES